jgi:hypothetical protein
MSGGNPNTPESSGGSNSGDNDCPTEALAMKAGTLIPLAHALIMGKGSPGICLGIGSLDGVHRKIREYSGSHQTLDRKFPKGKAPQTGRSHW